MGILEVVGVPDQAIVGEGRVQDLIREEIRAVYDAVGRSGSVAPQGLGVATGRKLARILGYRDEDLAQAPLPVLEAFVGAAALAEAVTGRPPEWVLDLGCGAGLDSWILTRRGYRVLGLDASAPLLQRLAPERGAGPPGPARARAFLPAIPVRAATAGWALLNGVANLVPERAALLQELRRVLRPGGTLLVADLVAIGDVPPELRRLPEAWAWCLGGASRLGEWEAGLADAGFAEVRVTLLEEIPPFARALIRARRS